MNRRVFSLLLVLTSLLFAIRPVAAQGTCAVEICRAEPTPPACDAVNENFDDSGCPDDFETNDMDFCFSDAVPADSDYPNNDSGDGQIWVRGDQLSGQLDCGTIRVKETGYYALFDSELSESCADQLDETGYLTVHNSCNLEGWATTRNVGERYLVEDQDNEGAGCQADSECDAGQLCREVNSHGRCCVPENPVFMGTFLLVAGEENIVCLHHWCPEWKELSAEDSDTYEDVFVHDGDEPSNNCVSPDSIHFLIAATAIACRQEGYLQTCAAGCDAGECSRHPCDSTSCPRYCRAEDEVAECVDESPCENASCEHGCVHGLCLQGPDARGEDSDDDGYVDVSDCDDDNPDAHPGADEDCDNEVDDDCNGFIDDCGQGTIDIDPGPDPLGAGGEPSADSTIGSGGSTSSAGSGKSGEDGGCGCRAAPASSSSGAAGALGLLVALCGRRRRRPWSTGI